MDNWYLIFLIETERRKDEIARVEQYRLVKRAIGRREAVLKRHQRVIVFLGGLLVSWGCGLQSRYDEFVVVSTHESTSNKKVSPCSS